MSRFLGPGKTGGFGSGFGLGFNSQPETATPTITAVSSNISTNGGYAIISGTNFQSFASFNPTATWTGAGLLQCYFLSTTSLLIVTAYNVGQSIGSYNVTIMNPDGQTATAPATVGSGSNARSRLGTNGNNCVGWYRRDSATISGGNVINLIDLSGCQNHVFAQNSIYATITPANVSFNGMDTFTFVSAATATYENVAFNFQTSTPDVVLISAHQISATASGIGYVCAYGNGVTRVGQEYSTKNFLGGTLGGNATWGTITSVGGVQTTINAMVSLPTGSNQTVSAYVDGGTAATLSTTQVTSPNLLTFSIGSLFGGSGFVSADIAEVIVANNKAVADASWTNINNDLATLYHTDVPQGISVGAISAGVAGSTFTITGVSFDTGITVTSPDSIITVNSVSGTIQGVLGTSMSCTASSALATGNHTITITNPNGINVSQTLTAIVGFFTQNSFTQPKITGLNGTATTVSVGFSTTNQLAVGMRLDYPRFGTYQVQSITDAHNAVLINLGGPNAIVAGTSIGANTQLYLADPTFPIFMSRRVGSGVDGILTPGASGGTTLTREFNYSEIADWPSGSSATFTWNASFIFRVGGRFSLVNAPTATFKSSGGFAANGNANGTGGGGGTSASSGRLGLTTPSQTGGAGQTGNGTGTASPAATFVVNGSPMGAGGNGGAGSGGRTGGTAGTPGTVTAPDVSGSGLGSDTWYLFGASLVVGGQSGTGGGGGGGDGTNKGGGGGGSGGGNSVMGVFASELWKTSSVPLNPLTFEQIGSQGGVGGTPTTGNAGGGGAGSCGGTGWIMVGYFHRNITSGNIIPILITEPGLAGGNGVGTGTGGFGGASSGGGRITFWNMSSTAVQEVVGAAGNPGNAPSGITGGTGGAASANTQLVITGTI